MLFNDCIFVKLVFICKTTYWSYSIYTGWFQIGFSERSCAADVRCLHIQKCRHCHFHNYMFGDFLQNYFSLFEAVYAYSILFIFFRSIQSTSVVKSTHCWSYQMRSCWWKLFILCKKNFRHWVTRDGGYINYYHLGMWNSSKFMIGRMYWFRGILFDLM